MLLKLSGTKWLTIINADRCKKNLLIYKIITTIKLLLKIFNVSRVTLAQILRSLWKHHRPWRRYSLPFRSRQSISPAPSQLLCTSSPTLSRFLPAPPLPPPSTAPRMRAARMQPDKATATISVFPRLFSPSFRAISPFSTATCSTIQGNERKWRMFVACSSRENEPLSQMTASAEYRHLERR